MLHFSLCMYLGSYITCFDSRYFGFLRRVLFRDLLSKSYYSLLLNRTMIMKLENKSESTTQRYCQNHTTLTYGKEFVVREIKSEQKSAESQNLVIEKNP